MQDLTNLHRTVQPRLGSWKSISTHQSLIQKGLGVFVSALSLDMMHTSMCLMRFLLLRVLRPYPVLRVVHGIEGNAAFLLRNAKETPRSGILVHTGDWVKHGWPGMLVSTRSFVS